MTEAAAAPLQRLRSSLRGAAGIARSLRIYYGNPKRRRQMAALYQQFMKPGDLVFDIGSHVGDRISAFRAAGARVVAVEPQPAAFRWLKFRYGRDPDITLVQAALGEAMGQVEFHLNLANPTISTASPDFMAATNGAAGWEGQHWDQVISVPAVTLDALVAQYGKPAFVKVDVEGYELNVLRGLSQPLPALSFEFTTIQRDVALACLNRLSEYERYRFNIALGESQQLELAETASGAEMAAFINALPHNANSGDVYAVLDESLGRSARCSG